MGRTPRTHANTTRRSMNESPAVVTLKVLLRVDREADGKVLFGSYAALTRRLYSDAAIGNAYDRWESFNSHFNQMVRGERPISAGVAEAMEVAVRERLAGLPEAVCEDWVGRLKSTLQYLEEARAIFYETAPRYTGLEVPPIESVFVVCPGFPAARRTANGRHMLRTLMSMRGLTLSSVSGAPRKQLHYTFCFPDTGEGWDFWRAALEESLVDTDGNPQVQGQVAVTERLRAVADRLEAIEAEEFVIVLTLPPTLCVVPICLYHRENGKIEGFILTYEDGVVRGSTPVPAPVAQRMHTLEKAACATDSSVAEKISFASCRYELVREVIETTTTRTRHRQRAVQATREG